MGGTALKDARLERGYSLHELERRTGISNQLLSQYEAGLRYPDDEHVRLLARALDSDTLSESFLTRSDVRKIRGVESMVVAIKRLARKMGLS